MLEKLAKAGDTVAAGAVTYAIAKLSETPVPGGVHVEAIGGGVLLSGRRLRRRMLDDPQLRNFGK
ncbi:hypothetical protein [Sphingorhabdus contaminans]|uniref:Uncharacterized protein n=1 Tax=Sphingorhabdus contaminans TaxID=1343899 RepID=A0A553W9N3_9SPHN|nr:hypothetical protein [Sphingorhabdus contaminans]TSB01389.1 hypothetical protein FOM92_09280 [Sphingorhabdus contaminans]